MEECFEKGMQWVPDRALLELASECLPPPLEYALDEEAVAGGTWKQAVRIVGVAPSRPSIRRGARR